MATLALVWALVTGAAVSGLAAAATAGPSDGGAAAGTGGSTTALGTVQDNGTSDQTRFGGAGQDDRLGHAVASAGDVNGDGVSDVLVGAPTNDSGGSNAGAVYLFYGPVEGDTRNVSEADATLLGDSAGDRAGFAIAGGDVNGDGYADVVVGAPLDDESGEDAGAVHVVYGGESLSGTVSLSEADAKLVGEAEGDHAGFSVAARSVDASGDASILVGAPTNPERGGTGAAYLLAADSLAASTDLSEADATFQGEAEGDLAGWSVAWAGDATDDGTADALVGAHRHDPETGVDAGAAYLVNASAEGSAALGDAATATFVGESVNDTAGWSVAGAGDVDGDGVDDVLVGAPARGGQTAVAGAAYVVFGSASLGGVVDLGATGASFHGEAAGDQLGWSVASAGDVDCDGVDDVLVGAPYLDRSAADTGGAYLVYGNTTAEFGAVTRLSGDGEGALLGFDVADAGDVDGDGSGDVLLGAPFDDSRTGGGAAYLQKGACRTQER